MTVLKTGGTSQTFSYDRYGNLTGDAESGTGVTTMAYDLGDKLVSITPAGGSATTFTYDALSRPRTRSVGGAGTETYSYVGTTKLVDRIAVNGGPTTDAILDPAGGRLGALVGTSLGYYLADLHGSIAAVEAGATTTITAATRYDAYGQTVAAYPTGGTDLSKPWQFQGRLDLSPTLTAPLYDFDARLYAPGIGAFSSIDQVIGAATDPRTMNRYLYAAANPATLVDPDGHFVSEYDSNDPYSPTGGSCAYIGDWGCGRTATSSTSVVRAAQPKPQPGGPIGGSEPGERDAGPQPPDGIVTPVNPGISYSFEGADVFWLMRTPGGLVLIHEWVEASGTVSTDYPTPAINVSLTNEEIIYNIGPNLSLRTNARSGALSIRGPGAYWLTESGDFVRPRRGGGAGYSSAKVVPVSEVGFAARSWIPGADWASGYDTTALTRQAGIYSKVETSVRVHVTGTPVVLAFAVPVLVQVVGISATAAAAVLAEAAAAGIGARVPIPVPVQ